MTDTGKTQFQGLLFHVLVLLAGYLTYLVLSPFLQPLAWAAVLAMLLYGGQARLEPRIGPGRAALVMTLLSGVLIVAPGVMLVSTLAREVPLVVDHLQQASAALPDHIGRIWTGIVERSPVALPADPAVLLREGVQRALAFLAPRAGAVLADVFATLGSLVVMLFTLFFMLRDGHILVGMLRRVLPLPVEECERLMRHTYDLVIASVGAGMAVAATQGAIAGVTYWLLGIRAPAFWGVVTAFCSLIPVVGATLVWIPIALVLFVSGEVGRGVVMVAVGGLGISMADNVLRPLLLSGHTSVHGLVIFLGLLGGVAAFGFIGLVIGPIILVTAGSLLEIFTRSDLAAGPAPEPRVVIDDAE